jgi:PPOX class probable F420-dependent enzyme
MTDSGPSRFELEHNCWLATVRPDGRPHLVPIWFVWLRDTFWLCSNGDSVKSRNMRANPNVSLSLESGADPVVIEGVAQLHERPYPADVVAAFHTKFQWNITGDVPDPDGEFTVLAEIRPVKWLMGAPPASDIG